MIASSVICHVFLVLLLVQNDECNCDNVEEEQD